MNEPRWRRWGRRLAKALAAALGSAWLVYCGVFWQYQDGFVFQPPDWADAASLHATATERGVTELALVASDGTQLAAWHQGRGGDRLLLFLSGNGEAMSDYLAFHDLVAAEGFDLLTVAWRGYPGSAPVAPTEEGLTRDARAAWDWAVGPGGYAPERIVVHGRSLGGGVAAALVRGGAHPKALVLESTFGRMAWVLARWAPLLPQFALLRHPFDTVGHADALQLPTLVLAAGGDDLIPPDIGGRVLSRALPDARYLEVPGLSHQDDLPVASPEARAVWSSFVQGQVPAR